MNSAKYTKYLAEAVETAINRTGKSKAAVAKEAGIPWTTFSRRLKHPETSSFTVPELINIANSLGVSWSKLCSDAEQLYKLAA